MIEHTVAPIISWPKEYTTNRMYDRFGSIWTQTLSLLEREIDQLWGDNIVFRAAVTHGDVRRDGQLRARATPSHPGIMICFDSMHGPLAYACDSYFDWKANVRAIALSLEALRKVDRYGVSGKGEQYSGFKQIAAPGGGTSEMDVQTAAGVLINAANEDCSAHEYDVINDPIARNRVYRKAAKNTHPDRHGDNARFQIVSQAYKVLRA